MRTSKAQKEAQAALEAQVKAAQPQPVAANIDEEMTLREMFATFGVQLPSWKRTLLAFVTSFAVGYLIGSVAAALINLAFAGAAVLGMNLFFIYIIALMLIIGAIYLAIKASQRIVMYFQTGDIDRDLVAAKEKVTGFFRRAPKEIVAA